MGATPQGSRRFIFRRRGHRRRLRRLHRRGGRERRREVKEKVTEEKGEEGDRRGGGGRRQGNRRGGGEGDGRGRGRGEGGDAAPCGGGTRLTHRRAREGSRGKTRNAVRQRTLAPPRPQRGGSKDPRRQSRRVRRAQRRPGHRHRRRGIRPTRGVDPVRRAVRRRGGQGGGAFHPGSRARSSAQRVAARVVRHVRVPRRHADAEAGRCEGRGRGCRARRGRRRGPRGRRQDRRRNRRRALRGGQGTQEEARRGSRQG